MNREVVIVSANRTPIGSFLGSLSTVSAPNLGAVVIKAVLEKTLIPFDEVDEVLIGNVLQAGIGQSPARQAALFAGLPDNIPATTINKVCSSGMKSVMQAAQAIALGDAEVVVAGGMENMSLVPHYHHARLETKFGTISIEDGLQKDGLSDAFNRKTMGALADACATHYKISREDQDEFAIQSYQRTRKAWKEGKFLEEVVPVTVPQRRGETIIVSEDEEYSKFNADKMNTLRPAFTEKGTVTAANASTINDGAAALVLMSASKAESLGIKPIARIVGYADASHDPRWFTTAPAIALPKALDKASLSIDDIDCFELNEAFSLVGLVNQKLLGIDSDKVNINGGAVSMGHPLGCSGARILVSLIHILKQNGKTHGAAAICNGGGGASAMILRREY